MKTGEVLRERRKTAGLTQAPAANALGITAPAVSKWERGLSCPDLTLLTVTKLVPLFEKEGRTRQAEQLATAAQRDAGEDDEAAPAAASRRSRNQPGLCVSAGWNGYCTPDCRLQGKGGDYLSKCIKFDFGSFDLPGGRRDGKAGI